jgi:hypothetical protein
VTRDVALSRVDDLTLNLSSARREVAALRAQLSKQQQELLHFRVRGSVNPAAGMTKPYMPGTSGGGSSRPGSSWGLGAQQQQQQVVRGVADSGFVSPTRQQQQQQRAWYVSPAAGVRSRVAAAEGGGGNQRAGSPSHLANAQYNSSPQQQQQHRQRLTELEAAEAALAAQAEALQRHASQQRSNAAQQLQDLRAAAAATQGAAATAVSAAAARSSRETGLSGSELWSPALQLQQQQPRHQLDQQQQLAQPGSAHGQQGPGTPGFDQSFVAGEGPSITVYPIPITGA